MFPSFNSIEEIRVSESNNNAEFSGVADITTVSKAGTVNFHGGLFENNENTVFNSNNTFALTKPRISMNDFGGTLGGPLRIPFVDSKVDHDFFFASYEGLRLPRETPMLLSVPSAAMRTGDSYRLLRFRDARGSDADADCGKRDPIFVSGAELWFNRFLGEQLPDQFPFANLGEPGRHSGWTGRSSSRQSAVFARFSYKNRQVSTAPSAALTFTFCAEAGSPLQGAYNTPEIDEGVTFAHNFVFNARLLNEFRGGFNGQHTSETQSYSTADLAGGDGISQQPCLSPIRNGPRRRRC